MLGRDKLQTILDKAWIMLEEENGDTAIAGTCLLLIEVRTAEEETAFYTFSNDKRQWIQRALITEAKEAIEMGGVLEGEE